VTEKPENRKTITIKINGKDRPFQNKENQMKSDEQQDAFVNNKDSILPENSAEEVAAGSEALEDESFDWILPNAADEEESDDIKEFQLQTDQKSKGNMLAKMKQKGSKRNLSKGMVASIFFAVFFAIVLGTGFGFVLLKMVDTDKAAIAGNNASAPAQSAGTDYTGEAAAGTVAATKAEISTFVVQNNIYTAEDGADKEVDRLTEKGIVAQKVPIDGKFAIYLGIAADIDNAKSMKTEKEADGASAFAKEMVFPGGEAGKVTSTEKQFLDAAPEIYGAASDALTAAYAGGTIQEDTAKKLSDQQKILDEMKISEFKEASIKKAAEGLASGVKGAAALGQDSSAANQEAVQKSLLAFLANYVEIGS